MLQKLSIKNIALIDEIDIDFLNGLNVLTGETGAGKSIIIDAISFLLGARSDKSLIRSGQNEAKVKANFYLDDIEKYKEVFDLADIEPDNMLIISRSMNIDGKSEAKINGENISASMLKEITSSLVEIYAQHEQLSILKTKNQLAILDNFAGDKLKLLQKEYQQKLEDLANVNEELSNFGGSEENRLQELDLLSYQIQEIENSKLNTDEELELTNKLQKFQNIEKIVSNTTIVENQLNTIMDSLNLANSSLSFAEKYDETLADLSSRLSSQKIELSDILDNISEYNSSIDYTEKAVDEIMDRLDLYKKLKRKYGNTIEDINNFLSNIKIKNENLENSTERINALNNQKKLLITSAFDFAKKITNIRIVAGKNLCNQIINNLKDLGMPNAQLNFAFNSYECEESAFLTSGADKVELMFNANLGEDLKPLSKIASGGEISRLMLAFKTVISNLDNLSTMIFDEIDSGISGKMAQAVAEKMARISRHHQVFLITHSPQITSMADNNLFVEKIEKNGKTQSHVKVLLEEQKIMEVARFLSTDSADEFSIKNAEHLIKEQDDFKKSL